MRRLFVLILLCVVPWMAAAQSILLTGIHVAPSSTVTRVDFYLNKKTFGRVIYSPQSKQLIVRFANCDQRFVLRNLGWRGANINEIRSEKLANGDLQIIFTLMQPVTYQSFFKLDNVKHNATLQLNIISTKTKPAKLLASKNKKSNQYHIDIRQTFANSIAHNNEEMHSIKLAAQARSINLITKKPKFITIIVDAGHGGHDSGALGIKGTKEKTVALAIAKKVAAKINQSPNMRAVLTRKGDYFVSLRERLLIARRGNADLFIAIHADASPDANAKGASIYALSERGATTVAARWLAERENHEELGDIALYDLQDQSKMLRSVLIDLAQTNTTNNSIRLGRIILDAIDELVHLHYKRVEQAPFLVLKSPDIPSILIETGYITNPSEEMRLANNAYQQKMANAIYAGINRYVESSFLKSDEGEGDAKG